MDAAVPGSFLAPLRLEHEGGRRWMVVEEFTYLTRAGELIVVPAGFVTDGASVPRLLWWLFPPFGGNYDEAAVIHDHLYSEAELYAGDDDGHVSRAHADTLMLEAMGVKGVDIVDARLIYRGVRLGGWWAWRRHRAAARRRRP